MKKWNVSLAAGVVLACLLAGCGKNDTTTQETTVAATTEAVTTEQATEADAQIATGSDLASASDVVEDWMVPIPAENVADGEYDIEVDSSSSMFNITACKLTVADGKMTAVMTMGGKGYRYLYMGTAEDAVAADESEYIPYVEDADGAHTFTVPVDALDVFGKYVRGVHGKDGLYPTDGRELGQEVPIGEGKVDFPRFIARLKECGYDGDITIKNDPESPSVLKTLYILAKRAFTEPAEGEVIDKSTVSFSAGGGAKVNGNIR